MSLRYCPECQIISGKNVYTRKGYSGCSMCHGKKKVSSSWYKWYLKRKEYLTTTARLKVEELMKKELENMMEKWDKRFPAPKKF